MTHVNTYSQSPASRSVDQTVLFLNYLFPEPRTFAVRLWEGTLLPSRGDCAFTITLKTPGILRRMMQPSMELHISEAFIRGELEIEGDLSAVFNLYSRLRLITRSVSVLVTLLRLALQLPGEPQHSGSAREPAQLAGRIHSQARDRAAIQYHYDVGNEFYASWLDKRMVYSCAYFPTGKEDIDTAQERKLEYCCRKLHLQPGEYLLDIGCGWGGLVIYAAQKYGVSALGVTLSQAQCELANQRIAEAGLSHCVQVKCQDYRELTDQNFDKVISIGMFEHVGPDHLPEYFAHVWRLLNPGGLFLNHGISAHPAPHWRAHSLWERFANRYIFGTGSFMQRYIFPDGDLIPVSQVNLRAEEAGFEVRDVENLREHYALTLRHWGNRLMQSRREIGNQFGEMLYRTWKLYLAASEFGFDSGLLNVNQTLLAKGGSQVPLTRSEWYPV